MPLAFPPGVQYSTAQGLSADGSTVVGAYLVGVEPDWEWAAFRWAAGTGTVTLPVPCQEGFAAAVSADGGVAVGSACGNLAARWVGAGPCALLGQLPGGKQAFAFGASADGSVVVGSCWIPALNASRAFRWTAASGMQEIPASPTGPALVARAISADGLTVVGETAGYSPYRWTASGGTQDLGPPGSFCRAEAVTADGTVVIGTCIGGGDVLFRWTLTGGMELLPTWPFQVYFFGPMAVSGDGSVIVGQNQPSPNGPNWSAGWRWTEERGIEYLNDVLAALGSAPAGTRIASANGVSADGRTIAGDFIRPDWMTQAWIGVIPIACYADCNHDLALTIADFGCFQTKFVQAHPFGDCNRDGVFAVADFACYQSAFVLGCP